MNEITYVSNLFSTNENMMIDTSLYQTEAMIANTEAFLAENENIYGTFTDVQEGVLGDIWYVIKDIAKKAVQFVIWLWKSLVKFVKKVIRKIANWLTGEDSKATARTHIKKLKTVNVYTIESAGKTRITASSNSELQKKVLKEINKITKEIHKRSEFQINASKYLEKMVEKNKHEIARESFSFVDEAKRMGGTIVDLKGMAQRQVDNLVDEDTITDIDTRKKIDLVKALAKGAAGQYAETVSPNVASSNLTLQNNLYNRIQRKYDELIVKGDNVVEIYNKMVSPKGLEEMFIDAIGKDEWELSLKITKLTKEQVIEGMIRDYHLDIKDPNAIKLMAKLRINYNNKMIKVLTEMVKLDYQIFGLTKTEIDAEILKIQGGNTDILKNVTWQSADKYKIPGTSNYDFRPIGGGVIFLTPYDLGFLEREETFNKLFNLCMRWDAVVIAHGGVPSTIFAGSVERERKHYLEWNKEADEIIKEYTKSNRELHNLLYFYQKEHPELNMKAFQLREKLEENPDAFGDEIRDEYLKNKELKEKSQPYRDIVNDIEEKEKETENRFKEAWKERTGTKNDWTCQPIQTLSHGPSWSVYKVVENLMDEGFKRIFVACCNPKNRKMPDHIMARPGVVVNYGNYTRILT